MTLKLLRRAAFGWPATPNAATAACANGLVVHYDGSDQGLAKKEHLACVTYWRNTRSFHMGSQRGWNDIGYSFGCCPHGYVFEGRGWQRQQAAQPGGNSTWTSVTFMSGDHEKPTTEQLQAFNDLRAYLRSKGLRAGIKGHRDFISTSCPGTPLYTLVKDSKSALYATTPTTAPSWTEKLMAELPVLTLGDKGEDVQTIQALLIARSREIKMTGVFDAATVKAVKAFQKWGGLDDDGVWGKDTWTLALTRKRKS